MRIECRLTEIAWTCLLEQLQTKSETNLRCRLCGLFTRLYSNLTYASENNRHECNKPKSSLNCCFALTEWKPALWCEQSSRSLRPLSADALKGTSLHNAICRSSLILSFPVHWKVKSISNNPVLRIQSRSVKSHNLIVAQSFHCYTLK